MANAVVIPQAASTGRDGGGGRRWTFALWWRQTKVLTWKNVLLQSRNRVATAAQVC